MEMRGSSLIMKNVFIIIFIFSGIYCQAQTRFHFTSTTGTSDVTGAISSWTNTSASTISRSITDKSNTAIASQTIAVNNSSSTASTCFYRGVSPSLKAQTISGTVKGQFRMNVSSTNGCTAVSAVKITVINSVGTVVATLLSITSGTLALTTTLTNRISPAAGTAIGSYTCADGDRIVIEIGVIRTSGTTARNGTISFGDNAASDLTEDNTATSVSNPWMEFSATIKFNKGVPAAFF